MHECNVCGVSFDEGYSQTYCSEACFKADQMRGEVLNQRLKNSKCEYIIRNELSNTLERILKLGEQFDENPSDVRLATASYVMGYMGVHYGLTT